MIRALVDTNVLIDFLARREPFYLQSRRLLIFAAMGDYELWMSASPSRNWTVSIWYWI